MSNLSFTTKGANPFSVGSLGVSNGMQTTTPSTPIGKALNTAASAPAVLPTSAPVPSTPVKSTTVSNPDGSTHTTVYHAPEKTGTTEKASASTPAQTPTFSGLLSSLVGAGKGSEKAKGYIQDTANYGKGNIDIGQQAQDISNAYGKKIADVGNLGAKFQGGQLTTGTSPVAEGNAAVTAQTTAAQQQALATGEEAALQGIGYQLTGQNQAAGAANQAAGQSNTAQGLQNTALGTAAGYAQPSPTAQGQGVFNPTTGKIEGGSFDVSTNASNFSQNVLNGSMTYDQAVQSLGYSPVGKAALDQAITAAGGNPLELQAQGSAQQSIIGTQQEQIAGYTSALQQGQNLQLQLADLISTFGLNPNDVNAVNIGLQKIAANISSPQYKILQNYVNDIANTYSQILTPPGGSPTDTTRGIATSMLDATAKGQSLITTMKSLDEAAKAKIAGVPTTGVKGGGSSSGSKTGVVQTKAGAVNTDW